MNNLVTLMSGKAVTTSLKIAEVFGKQHKNVLQSIDNLKSQLPAEWHKLNFQPTQIERKTPTGGIVKSKMYFITRDGFTLLAMGFTGKRAMQFKLAYIAAFNAMEAELAARHNAPEPAPLDLTQSTRRMLHALNLRIEAGENVPAHILKYAWNLANATRTRVYAADEADPEMHAVFSVFAKNTPIPRCKIYSRYCETCEGTPLSPRSFWPRAKAVIKLREQRTAAERYIVIL